MPQSARAQIFSCLEIRIRCPRGLAVGSRVSLLVVLNSLVIGNMSTHQYAKNSSFTLNKNIDHNLGHRKNQTFKGVSLPKYNTTNSGLARGQDFGEKIENDCYVTSIGESKFIEFGLSGSGFMPLTHACDYSSGSQFTHQGTQENIPGGGKVRFSNNRTMARPCNFHSDPQTSGAGGSYMGGLSKYDHLSTMASKFSQAYEKPRYTTGSQFSPFTNLVSSDEKLSSQITKFTTTKDHLK